MVPVDPISVSRLLTGLTPEGAHVRVQGWIRTSRFAKKVTFIHLYDGSTEKTVQIVLSPPADDALRVRLGVGAALDVTGVFAASPGPEQPHEIKATLEGVTVVGDCDASDFPVQKKEASPEFYRTIPHLRVRTQEFQRIFLARNTVSTAIHEFFRTQGFMWVHTPILTASDCEGAGEMFGVVHHKETADSSFFGQPAYMTVSGQLDAEPFACAFSKVYTFGPTFRAENSNTARHAAEFWMIEPEVAFADVGDVMDLAEELVRTCAHALSLTGAIQESAKVALSFDPFARITYAHALEILEESGRKFEHPVGWEHPLQTEHERYLAEVVFKGPVFVTDYPAQHKSFYMRLNDGCSPGRQTVACFDLLVPGTGEIIGGSQREERLDKLLAQIERCKLDPSDYQHYIDLRRYGTVPHGGFGLGLERILMWLLGVPNIRDVLPYPRTPGSI